MNKLFNYICNFHNGERCFHYDVQSINKPLYLLCKFNVTESKKSVNTNRKPSDSHFMKFIKSLLTKYCVPLILFSKSLFKFFVQRSFVPNLSSQPRN